MDPSNHIADLQRKQKISNPLLLERTKYSNLFELILNSELNTDAEREANAFLQNGLIDNKELNDANQLHEALHYAASLEKPNWIDYFLDKGADPTLVFTNDQHGVSSRAVDEAWKNKDYEVVLKLLEADGPFPQSCTLTDLLRTKEKRLFRLKDFAIKREKLHNHINCQNIEEVKRFVSENPTIKRAYFLQNSALTAALKRESYEIYAYLRSIGFDVDDGHNEVMKRLNKNKKRLLDIQVQKFFKTANVHILDLLSKSRLAPSNDRRRFENIKDLYETLDSIPECQPLVKIAASCENLRLFFDFDRQDINELEPTTIFNQNYIVNGRTSHESEFIKIAAARERNEVLGTLAHEFAHFAMLKTFNNNFLPYSPEQEKQMMKYKGVVDRCGRMKQKNEVIASVFQYEATKIESELIVRVPQLLAMYNKKSEILTIRKDYEDLFEFYDLVLKDMKIEVLLIGPKRKIYDIKKSIELPIRGRTNLISIDSQKIDFDEIISGENDKLIQSQLPELLFHSLFKQFSSLDSIIFCKSKHLILADFSRIFKNDAFDCLRPTLIILDSPAVELSKFENTLQICKLRTIVLSNKSRVFKKLMFNCINIDLSCNYLSSTGKKEILNQSVIFQDEDILLHEIINDIDDFGDMPLEEMMIHDKKSINSLKTVLSSIPDHYVERAFKSPHFCNVTNSGNSQDLCNFLLQNKVLMLTGEQGMGKTISAKTLIKTMKQQCSKRWFAFVSLKESSNKPLLEEKSVPLTTSFLSKSLLRLEDRLEQAVFEYFFKKKKIVFIFDGFEAVSSSNNGVLLHIFDMIIKQKNILVVTTQHHFRNELQTILSITATELMPLGKKSQQDFVSNLVLSNSSLSDKQELNSKAQFVLAKTSFHENLSLQNPQLLQKWLALKISNNEICKLIQNSAFNDKATSLFNLYLKQGADVNFRNSLVNDQPLLMTALKEGKFDWIPLLLQKNADVSIVDSMLKDEVDAKTASEVALKRKMFNITVELLKADGAFPEKMKEKRLPNENYEMLVDIIESRAQLHREIANCQQEKIEQFILENPRIKCAYNDQNKCALSTALEARALKTYAFLRSRGFSTGIDRSHDNIMDLLTKAERKYLHLELRKFFKKPKTYILDLVSKSSLGLNSGKNFYDTIPNKFESLDETPGMQPILQIAANAKNLLIIFDFNQNDSFTLNDTSSFDEHDFKISKTILINAINKTEPEILSVLAYKLTFLAISLTFKNNYLPFFPCDIRRQSIFKEISMNLRGNSSLIELNGIFEGDPSFVPSVLKFKLLYMNQQQKLETIRKSLRKMFDYFEEFVLKDLEIEASSIQSKRKVRKMNRTLGLLWKLSSIELKCKCPNQTIEEITLSHQNTYIQSDYPEFLLVNLIAHLRKLDRGKLDSNYIFADAQHLMSFIHSGSIKEYLDKRLGLVHQPTLIILHSEGILDEALILKCSRENGKVIFVGNEIEYSKTSTSQYQVKFKWNDLLKETEAKLLKMQVEFQNQNLRLEKFTEIDPESFRELPFEYFLHAEKNKSLAFGKFRPNKATFVYIERFFKVLSDNKIYSLKTVIKTLESSRTVILTGSAGSGKTTAAIELAKTCQRQGGLSWIVFIKLNDETTAFLEEYHHETVTASLFLEELGYFENSFEQRYFEYFYENSRVIFVFDGYDKVTKYSQKIQDIFEKIQDEKNYLIITTKSHALPSIDHKLITMAPLTRSDQEKFLTLFSEKTANPTFSRTKMKNFLDNVSLSLPESNFLEHPKHLCEISEMDFCSTNIFSLHDHLYRNKCRNQPIWCNGAALLKLHQKIALKSLLGEEFASLIPESGPAEKNYKDLALDKGLIQITETMLQFEHKSFADYFASIFIFQNKSKSKRSDVKMQDLFIKVICEHQFTVLKGFIEIQNADETLNRILFCESVVKSLNYVLGQSKERSRQSILRQMIALLLDRNFNRSVHLQIKLLEKVIMNHELFEQLWDSIVCFTEVEYSVLFSTIILERKIQNDDLFSKLSSKTLKILTHSYFNSVKVLKKCDAATGFNVFSSFWSALEFYFAEKEFSLFKEPESTNLTLPILIAAMKFFVLSENKNMFNNKLIASIIKQYIRTATPIAFSHFFKEFYSKLGLKSLQTDFIINVLELSLMKTGKHRELIKIANDDIFSESFSLVFKTNRNWIIKTLENYAADVPGSGIAWFKHFCKPSLEEICKFFEQLGKDEFKAIMRYDDENEKRILYGAIRSGSQDNVNFVDCELYPRFNPLGSKTSNYTADPFYDRDRRITLFVERARYRSEGPDSSLTLSIEKRN